MFETACLSEKSDCLQLHAFLRRVMAPTPVLLHFTLDANHPFANVSMLCMLPVY